MKKTSFTFYDFLWPKLTFSSIGLLTKLKNTNFLHCDSTKKYFISQFLHFDPRKRHWMEKSHKLLFTPTQQSQSRENYFSSLLFSLTHVRSVNNIITILKIVENFIGSNKIITNLTEEKSNQSLWLEVEVVARILLKWLTLMMVVK